MTYRSRYVLACLCLLAALGCKATAAPGHTILYISPAGNDNWSGSVAEVSADNHDGPFATLARAQAAVREALLDESRQGPITVYLRGGLYELAAPVVFTPNDSGTPAAPVVYEAYPGERPILSGGRRLTGWEQDEEGVWRVTLDEVTSGEWMFSQLWVDGQRRYRPRVPERGYRRIAEQVEPTAEAAPRGHDRMRYHEGDIDPAWHRLRDVEVLAFHIWSASRMRIGGIETDDRILTFTGPTRTSQRWGAFLKDHRYLAINVREALDAPGEWYLERASGELLYIAAGDEDLSEASVIAPRLETLVRFQGEIGQRRFVEHLTLRGLTFAHTNWNLAAQGQSFPQAEVQLGAAVEAVGARQVTIESCAVKHTGGYGLSLAAGCRDVLVRDCDIVDLGGGGIKIGTGGGAASWMISDYDAADPESAVSDITVEDCTIAHGGRLHPSAVGVWLGHASHCAVRYNDIFDFYYTGVSVGWVWGYAAPSKAHDNSIAHNHMHTIGQGVLSDMAGVYTLGLSPGTRVEYNRIHDVQAYDYGGWGLYTDEGSTGITMSNNLVYRTKTGGFHQHYGSGNRILNNIFVDSQIQQLQRTRTEEHLSFAFMHNLVYWTNDSPLLGSNWSDDHFILDWNLYFNPNHQIRFPGDLSLQDWRAKRGKDGHSLIADPGFVDAARDDYRLRPDSPALEIGFKPWDLSDAGRRTTPPDRNQPPVSPAFE